MQHLTSVTGWIADSDCQNLRVLSPMWPISSDAYVPRTMLMEAIPSLARSLLSFR